jgi:signal peptidase II
MIRRLTSQLALVVAIVATIGCDRVTKHVATTTLADGPGRSYLAGTIRLEYVENTGGFLSVGANWPRAARTALFIFGSGLMLLALAGAAVRFHWRGWLLIGAGLIFGGGASNWVDRLLRGSVVDFINVGIGPLRTGIFNVADVAISLGVVVLVLREYRPVSTSNLPTQ